MKRSRSLRAYVVHLVIAIILPLLGFGALLLVRSAYYEQQAIAATARERAQGTAADLDRELRNLQDLISILATSQYPFAGGSAMPHSDAASLLKSIALGLVVRTLSGQSLLNTCTAGSSALPFSERLDKI